MNHQELDDAARALYDAAPSRPHSPDWDDLTEVTRSVWYERVQEQPPLDV
jgi:hypothetical protein